MYSISVSVGPLSVRSSMKTATNSDCRCRSGCVVLVVKELFGSLRMGDWL